MPMRSQAKIRRDINRLLDTVLRHAASVPSLAAIAALTTSAAVGVNTAWQAVQMAATVADRRREERDRAVGVVQRWIQSWRSVVLLSVPGAADNLRALPAWGATPDDVTRMAQDLSRIITENEATAAFREAALATLGEHLTQAIKATQEATAARPAEAQARAAYTEAVRLANTVVVRGSRVVRAAFGPTSPEYKQLVGRVSAQPEAEMAR